MASATSPAHAPREIELKLEGRPEDLGQVYAALGLAGEAPAASDRLRATYFDTEAGALRKAGLTLRIREEGGRRLQTLKAQRSDASLLERGEWESEVRGETPDLALAAGTPLAPLLADGALNRALRPVFRVEVERESRIVEEGGSRIELVVDRGEVIAGERRAPIAEVELELKEGEPADLFGLGARLVERAPLRLALATKSERGYALLRGGGPKARKAEALALDPAMSSAAAFQAVARSCLRQAVANEAVLRATRHADAVHQMRVGFRRLRAALSLFKPMLEDERFDAVRAALRSMAGALGPARDLDVFIGTVLEPALDAEPDDPGLRGLVAEHRARREAVYDALLATLDAAAFRLGLLDALAWVESGPWLTAKRTRAAREAPIAEGAARILERRWKRLRRRSRGLARLTEEERHQVRIEGKKLRYAVEFFEGLFDGGEAEARHRAMLDALQALQGSLGDLNDVAVGSSLARAPADDGPEAEALARLMRQRQEGRVEELLEEAKQAARAFRKTEPFWS